MLLELSDACENNIISVISYPETETSQMLNIAIVSSHWLICSVGFVYLGIVICRWLFGCDSRLRETWSRNSLYHVMPPPYIRGLGHVRSTRFIKSLELALLLKRSLKSLHWLQLMNVYTLQHSSKVLSCHCMGVQLEQCFQPAGGSGSLALVLKVCGVQDRTSRPKNKIKWHHESYQYRLVHIYIDYFNSI